MKPAPAIANPGVIAAIKTKGFDIWVAMLETFGMDKPFTTYEAGEIINDRLGTSGTTGRQYALGALQSIEAEGHGQATRVGKRGRWVIPSTSPAWRKPS